MFRTCVNNLFIKRQIHGNTEIVQNCKEIRNRNPRNLERLRIARKPIGYALDVGGGPYWHKLNINCSQRYITAEIYHFENGPVITASTQEWGLKKQLYSTTDTTAYKFLGRVLAQRCLESGISEIYVQDSIITGNKIQLLLDEMSEHGIYLQEPKRYNHPNSANKYHPEKPWETYE
ncbi:39S ribosomal protein L18, mitochondrial [Anthophora retusa]